VSERFILLSLAFLAAHSAADFPLQSDRMVGRKGAAAPAAGLAHATAHAALSYIAAGFWGAWWYVLPTILLTHLAIDWFKPAAPHPTQPPNARAETPYLRWFALDQLAHLAVLLNLSGLMDRLLPSGERSEWAERFGFHSSAKCFAVAVGAIVCTWVGGIIIGLLVKPYTEQLDSHLAGQSRGFARGGRIIGRLERVLIFAFVLADQIAAVGFLVTAKSVLRFAEIKNSADRMEAEYVLIGTMWSFTWGVLAAYATKWAIAAL
jgi:hypothetical protein